MVNNDSSALLVIRTTWWDPQRAPTVQVVRAPLVDGRVVELDLALDLRKVGRGFGLFEHKGTLLWMGSRAQDSLSKSVSVDRHFR